MQMIRISKENCDVGNVVDDDFIHFVLYVRTLSAVDFVDLQPTCHQVFNRTLFFIEFTVYEHALFERSFTSTPRFRRASLKQRLCRSWTWT
jgi:hypothetical protein